MNVSTNSQLNTTRASYITWSSWEKKKNITLNVEVNSSSKLCIVSLFVLFTTVDHIHIPRPSEGTTFLLTQLPGPWHSSKGILQVVLLMKVSIFPFSTYHPAVATSLNLPKNHPSGNCISRSILLQNIFRDLTRNLFQFILFWWGLTFSFLDLNVIQQEFLGRSADQLQLRQQFANKWLTWRS